MKCSFTYSMFEHGEDIVTYGDLYRIYCLWILDISSLRAKVLL